MSDHRVVVIGAGMGGLASALRLAQQGLQVTVVEAGAAPGGKLRQLQVNGAPVDSGPTVFTMRWVFDQLLAAVGTTLEAELRIRPLQVLARHWWDDGSQLDLHADPAASLDAVGRFAGAAEAQRFARFCSRARAVYQTLETPYMRQPQPHPVRLTRDIGLQGLATLTALGPLTSLWSSLGRQFTDPRLRQLFARYATYTGSSPWQAPATLMLIAQVEMDGVWSIDGGMHALAACLERLARARGAVFHYGRRCERIELHQGRVCGVRLANGETLRADSVVFNGDAAALRTGLPAMRAGGARDWIAQRQSESPATYAWMHVELGLVGYGELHLEGSTASLCLWIGCDFRGRGFGTRLVKALCSLARANGLQRVLSAAFSDNLHSLRALRAAGFVEFEAEGFDRTCRHLVWTPHSLTPHEAQQHLVEFCRRRDRRRHHG